MRFKSSLAAVYALSAVCLSAGCIDVTCAERGTCPSEGNTDDDAATPSETRRDAAVSGSTRSSSETGSSRADDASVTSHPHSTNSSDGPSSGDAAVVGTSVGSSASSWPTRGSDSISETQTSETTMPSGPSQCEAGVCGCTADCSTSPEAGPVGCSPAEVAACSVATPICVLEEGAPLCLGCVTDEHCAAPTPICSVNSCEVCELESNRGCDGATPYCVSTAGPVVADAGATASSAAISAATPPNDASVTSAALGSGAMVDTGSAAADAGTTAATRACVECRTGADCTEGEPFCIDNACEQCQVDTDCTDPNAPRCDAATHQCSGCTELGACSRFAATPACNLGTGSCVECTAAEASACEDYACQTTPGDGQFTCSTQLLGDAESCDTCVGDAACGPNSTCILENFDNQDTEWVCLPEEPEAGCATGTELISTLTEATSVDGETGNFCKPAHTTCAGHRHFGKKGLSSTNYCQTDDDCGLPNILDGRCLPFPGSNTVRYCSYPCVIVSECPGSECNTYNSGAFRACSLD